MLNRRFMKKESIQLFLWGADPKDFAAFMDRGE